MNSQFTKLIKHAYLIGAPGGIENTTDYLKGVSKDLINFKRFLKSRKGGAWLENEITVLSDAHYIAIKDKLDFPFEGCRLIYFSGHGVFDKDTNTNCLQFQDRLVPDTDLINSFIPKQTIICDSCRNFANLGQIGGIGTGEEEWLNFDGLNEARDLYNKWIMSSPNGIQIFHAVPAGVSAIDTLSGGLFTNRLIRAAENDILKSSDYSYVTLNQIVIHLNHPNESRNKVENMPCCTYNEGNLNIPFAICLPSKNTRQIHQPSLPLQTTNNTISWNLAGGIALGIIATIAILDND